MGLLAKSTSGFGKLRVSGLKRVPNPPTRMSAFIFDATKTPFFFPVINANVRSNEDWYEWNKATKAKEIQIHKTHNWSKTIQQKKKS